MKMKKTDIGVVAFMYVICIFFYVYLQQLPKDSQTYPRFTIVLLFALTTLYLLTMIFNAKKYGSESGTDMFKGFLPLQFFFCLGMTVLYLIGIFNLGFFVSTAIFMAIIMLFLRVPWKYTLIAIVALNVLLYVAFVIFLKVKLPSGILI